MKKCLFLVLCLFWTGILFAQLRYAASKAENVAGTYTSLGTSGSIIPTANFDDANSAAQDIGFNFQFNGTSFTQFILSSNGFIKLGNVAPSSTTIFELL